MGSNFDFPDVGDYARGMHLLTAALVNGVDQFTTMQFMACGLASQVCYVEPSHHARSFP
ncbi:hypothetical protein LCGC14_2769000, partial [marine sediment metagenome]